MATLVYPGDEITTIFALERSTGNWSDTWSLAPGDIGRGAGAVPSGGGVLFDHSIDREFCFRLRYLAFGRRMTLTLCISSQRPSI
jgi:hypothetical protein